MTAPLAKHRPPWLFAAKTTLAALLGLLVAFTFNLDQPQWTLLTVLIVSQPRRDGGILQKSFARIIGTFAGAALALLLVAVAAQQRVLFIGALAAWVGLCTFGSQYARGWGPYAFVLSGYTVAIVGIPGALAPGDAFYIAVARVTEISLGIICGAIVAHLVFPDRLAPALWRTLADARLNLGNYAVAMLHTSATIAPRGELLGQAAAIEDLRCAAIFEDQDVRDRSDRIAYLNGTLIHFVGTAQLLGDHIEAPRPTAGSTTEDGRALAEAAAAIRAWQAGTIDAAELGQRLLQAQHEMTSAIQPTEPPSSDDEAARQLALSGTLKDFFAALMAFADAYEALASTRLLPASRLRITYPNDADTAALTGLRAALGVALAGSFWILADWPSGTIAMILTAVAVARVATMGHQVPLALAASLIFAFALIPTFIVVDLLLPWASGFLMFSLAVGPMLFLCALLIANERTMLIGYLTALLFAYAGFQNRMVYDPIALVNTTIAAVFAAGLTMVLWATFAPQTPLATRRRFVRAAWRALAPIIAADRPIALPEFESAMGGALVQFRTGLAPDRPDDAASFEAGITLLGAGMELILRRAGRLPMRDRTAPTVPSSDRESELRTLSQLRSSIQAAISRCLLELRRDPLDPAAVRATARDITTLQGELALRSGAAIRARQCEDSTCAA